MNRPAPGARPGPMERFIDRLCCPVCLHERGRTGALLVHGQGLACATCAAVYRTSGGVPDLRAPVGEAAARIGLDAAAERFYEKVYETGEYGQDVPDVHLESLRRWLAEVPADALVLELGAGRGVLQGLHPGYVGTDLAVGALLRHLRTPAFASDIQRLPLRSGSVGFAFTVATLEHVPRPELALGEIARVLAPGARAYLAPAWNCRPWAAEGLHVRPYRDLTPAQRVRKATIPLRNSLVWRGAWAIPRRALREGAWVLRRRPTPFRYRPLEANFETFWAADSDATADLDPHEAGLYFRSRGWAVLSPQNALARLFHRAQPLVVEKCAGAGN